MMFCRKCGAMVKNNGLFSVGAMTVLYTWLCRCGFMTTTREEI